MNLPASKTPIIFGEVLFDEFEDGARVLGGAPFNVAWHLQGFGLEPVMISRIGDDDYGEQIIAAMNNWGMSTAGIQRDPDHPTGRVSVAVTDGQPHFDIVADVAYDHIEWQDAVQVLTAHPPGLLYHGSLAVRSEVSRDTLQRLKQDADLPTFVDINLRNPWWRPESINALMSQAHWLKLNHDEMEEITGSRIAQGNLLEHGRHLIAQYHLDALILTRGAEGASLISAREAFDSPPVQVTELIDTVGAGDAFSAVSIIGLLGQWDYPTILKRASEFAARICAQRGATREDKELYQAFKRDWIL